MIKSRSVVAGLLAGFVLINPLIVSADVTRSETQVPSTTTSAGGNGQFADMPRVGVTTRRAEPSTIPPSYLRMTSNVSPRMQRNFDSIASGRQVSPNNPPPTTPGSTPPASGANPNGPATSSQGGIGAIGGSAIGTVGGTNSQ